jgi:hypothetical protein
MAEENMVGVNDEAPPNQVLECCCSLAKEKGAQHLHVDTGNHLIVIISIEELVSAFFEEIFE